MSYFWDRPLTQLLIKLLRSHECLWKTDHPNRPDRKKRIEAIQSIHKILVKYDSVLTPKRVHRRILSLRSQLRAEMRLIEKFEKLGTESTRRSKLWCYEDLSFMIPFLEVEQYVKKPKKKSTYDPLQDYAINLEDPEVIKQIKLEYGNKIVEDQNQSSNSSFDYTAEELEPNDIDNFNSIHNVKKENVTQITDETATELTKLDAEKRYYNDMAELAIAERTMILLECKKLKLEIRQLLRADRNSKYK